MWESELRASSIVDNHSTSELHPETETILLTTKRGSSDPFQMPTWEQCLKPSSLLVAILPHSGPLCPQEPLGVCESASICLDFTGQSTEFRALLVDSERNTLSHRNFSTLPQQSKRGIKMPRAREQGTCLSRAELPPGFLCPPQSADVTPPSQGSSRSTRRRCFLSWKVCPTRPALAQDSHRIPLSSHWPAVSCRNSGHRCGEHCFSHVFWNKIKSTLSS